jgi:hypothetical protein
MSCAEGQRLSTQFLQAAMAARDLRSREAPQSAKEKQSRKQEVERLRDVEERCKGELTAHAHSCPSCGSGGSALTL